MFTFVAFFLFFFFAITCEVSRIHFCTPGAREGGWHRRSRGSLLCPFQSLLSTADFVISLEFLLHLLPHFRDGGGGEGGLEGFFFLFRSRATSSIIIVRI